MSRLFRSEHTTSGCLKFRPWIQRKQCASPGALCPQHCAVTAVGRASLQVPIKKPVLKREFWSSTTSSKASGRYTWEIIWNWFWERWLVPWDKQCSLGGLEIHRHAPLQTQHLRLCFESELCHMKVLPLQTTWVSRRQELGPGCSGQYWVWKIIYYSFFTNLYNISQNNPDNSDY